MKTMLPSIVGALTVCASPMTFASSIIPIDPVAGVTVSTENGGFNRRGDFTVDGSGLSGVNNDEHSTQTGGAGWLTTGPGAGGLDPDPFIQFDLGAVFEIGKIQVWNWNEAGGTLNQRGVNSVVVEYGDTPALGSVLTDITSFTIAPGANGYKGEIFDDFSPFSARYIKFDIETNHGNQEPVYGLSEVQFFNAIPSPSAALVGLIGLGGLVSRRRRK